MLTLIVEKRVNKRGQGLEVSTIILIVLGVILLVFLVLGFSLGWANLWNKIGIFGGGASINDVVAACNLAVTSNNVYGYCEDFKRVKVGSQTEYVNCQDDRVQTGLDTTSTKPTCQGNSDEKFCQKLITDKQASATNKIKINNLDCPH